MKPRVRSAARSQAAPSARRRPEAARSARSAARLLAARSATRPASATKRERSKSARHRAPRAPSGALFVCPPIITPMGTMQDLGRNVERAMRVDLAAAFRLAVRLDLHEGVCNHFSAMLPDGKTFLLNRYGLHWSEVSASNLIALDGEGRILAGQGEIEKTAFYIHSRIHVGNPRAT